MCGRFAQVSLINLVEEIYSVETDLEIKINKKPNYNVSPGDEALVITNDKPKQLQLFQFGLTPFWAKKQMYLFNARSEGDGNKENDPKYKGGKGIITKPAFRKPIRSQRCLVIADFFYEGTTKERLSKPYLIYLRNKRRPFAFAGIWDTWLDKETGEEVKSFSIITTTANSLIQKIPHHKSPVILSKQNETRWLSNKPLMEITKLLKPYDPDLMNGYPVSPDIKSPKFNDKDIVKPLGDPLVKYLNPVVKKKWEVKGFGRSKKPGYDSLLDEEKG